MDVYEAIRLRRTVRDFAEKEINPELIKNIIGAGLRAPSNDHMRKWEFIVINDQSVRRQLVNRLNKNRSEKGAAEIVDHWGLKDQLQRAMYLDAIPKQYRMLLNAGCLIIPCFQQHEPLLQPKELSSLNGFASIWCCIENMFLAATAEGIYGVTRIPSDDETNHIKSTLKIPPDYEVPCYVALGYPAPDAKSIAQHPVWADERMHLNGW